MSMFGMTDTLKTLLIQEIYQRPLIWKPSDPRYTDVPARWVAFEEVAKALSNEKVQFSSDMVKMAWKNMTDYYNHIRRRNDRARAAGLTPPQSKWYFFNMLHFIRQEKSPAKRKYNWLEPSKIKSSSLNGDGANGSMNSDGSDALPRPIAIRPAPSDSVVDTSHRPRTKQSEKAKLQAKREALRDANLSTSSSMDSTTIKIKKEPTLKVIDVVGDNDNDADEDMNEDDDEMNDNEYDNNDSDASNDESVSCSMQNGPRRPSSARVKRQNVVAQLDKSALEIASDGNASGTATISRSGRRIVKRRLSLSPSPTPPQRYASQSQATNLSRTYTAQSPPNKRLSMSHTPRLSSRYANRQSSPSPIQRRSYSRAAVTTNTAMPQVYHMSGVSSRPVVALDSTSYFARGIAARLYLIKAESPTEYSNICDRIHEILLEAECALNIDTISG